MAWNASSPLVGPTRFPPIETTPLIDELIAAHAPVAIGVSGGKDSDVAAFETLAALERAEHKGPRALIHSDLGRMEHTDSRPACERLAKRLGLELIVVKRKAGDLMDRWLVRWQHNLERYRQLQCVKMILSFYHWVLQVKGGTVLQKSFSQKEKYKQKQRRFRLSQYHCKPVEMIVLQKHHLRHQDHRV